MDTTLETNAAVQTVRQAYDTMLAEPKPEWVRGLCPECGSSLVANAYYVGGRGYLIIWDCWQSLGESPACSYRKVL